VNAPTTVLESAQDRFDRLAAFSVGDVVPRNALTDLPLHRFGLRVSKDCNLPGRTW